MPLAAVTTGAVMALGQAPWNLPFVLFLTLPLLVWLSYARGPVGGFAVGWLAGLGYFSVTMFWIVEPFLVDAARHGWMAPFALVLLAAGLALFWGAGFAIGRVGRRAGLAGVLMLAVGWTLAEYGRTTLLTGFPWALTAYALEDTPLRMAAAALGPHGLGLAVLIIGALPAAFVGARLAGFAVSAAIVAGAWFGLQAQIPAETPMTETTLRLVQPNVDQHQKWKPENAQRFYDRLIELTQGHDDVDAVIWPEAAVPYVLNERPDLNAGIAAAAGEGATLILGALQRDPSTGAATNSLVALAPDGSIRASYEKHHLVPFGEYLPKPDWFDRLGLAPLAAHAGKMAAGSGALKITLSGLPAFQPLVCYEAIFPHEILRGDRRPDWLLQVTNDAWFGAISGPYQHLAQARFRAVEQGLPLVRAANTGVSAIVDPYGRIAAALSLGEMGVIDGLLPAPLEPTLYARHGDRPALLSMLVIFLVSLLFSRPRGAGA